MRVSRRTAASAALAAALPSALAQTSTSCNPLNGTCPADPGLNQASFVTDFTSGASKSWTVAEGTTLTYSDSQGALFSIKEAGQAPTISTDFYIFFGRVDVKMQAAPGTGIVSSIVFLSDDLDEIDWEFLGGNTTTVETNFFGKGNTTLYDRAIYYPVTEPETTVHTYSVDWTSEQIEWIIDGTTVRTLPYDSPLANGGEDYPQTPMRIKLGNWAGGGPGEPEGTVQWAGGATDFGDAPFNMYVESVTITNYNPADSYEYEGTTGSWQDIKVIKGSSTTTAQGSSSVSAPASTDTKAPTSSLSAGNVSNTNVAVSVTKTGGKGGKHSSTTSPATTTSTGSSGASSPASSTTPASSFAISSSSAGGPSSTANTNAAAATAVLGAGSLVGLFAAALAL